MGKKDALGLVLPPDSACSQNPEGVDDDPEGVLMNYTCSIILLLFTIFLIRKYKLLGKDQSSENGNYYYSTSTRLNKNNS